MDALNFLSELGEYKRLLNILSKQASPLLLTSLTDASKAHIAYCLGEDTKRPVVIITYNELRAKEIFDDISYFCSDVLYYPPKDIIFYSADVHSQDILKKRFKVIYSLIKGETPVIVIPISSIFDKLMHKSAFEKSILTLKVGDTIEMDAFIAKLSLMCYERRESIEGTGQFSQRGGIIDVFSPVSEYPLRIEFWDNEIDSIRIMDIASQRSVEKVDFAEIFPAKELIYTREEAILSAQKIEKDYIKAYKHFEENSLFEERDNLKEHIGESIEELKKGEIISAPARFIEYFGDAVSLFDYMPKDTLIFFDEPNHIKEESEIVLSEFGESIKNRITRGYMLPSQANVIYSYFQILKMAEKFENILLTTVSRNIKDFKIKETFDIPVRSMASFNRQIDMFCDEISDIKKAKGRTLILSGSRTRGERLAGEFSERGIEAVYVDDIKNFAIKPGMVVVSKGTLSRGFSYSEIGFSVFSDKELLGGGVIKKQRYRNKKCRHIESYLDLHVGDYIVHDSHGIGIFDGIEKITVDGINKDYIKIKYADGGNLFVPTGQMNSIQKYIGSDSAKPRLNKLGGQDWARTKSRVKEAVSVLAEDLVRLYAKRQNARGFAYSKDTLWQKEFEETFPYEETEDQTFAIEDVKHDMESGKIMDRLICGDVGYGKTEVAIRAAFKTVTDGKQVCYLVPTTILAQQHYNTFMTRLRNYPVSVDMLSRFKTQTEQKRTVEELSKGLVDIVIGTHRLLSKDVKFKDLGLIIVDEEQRFGVSHKEKLKNLKENVNVLTLTATPIPRTLHMSLTGIRDMSILEEPPLERFPIQTFVMENDPEFVKEAINRELARGGQVYYLHNKISNISEVTARLSKLVPKASIAYAHGRMSEHELEAIMKDFIDGLIDVLVCTTIIETGLDISNVNTIIIQDADKMGLAQLYQLRGRVGRSNKMAYAYLMYRKDKAVREVAEKRLQTIREFTEFGSGFKIAMRDLEIRGAGNLLGAEQHGHMESVGYDMYCRLLNEAVSDITGDIKEEEFDTSIDININAYIPSFYIKSEEQKLDIYRKIASIRNKTNYEDVCDEIIDRFGDPPKAVSVLLEIALVRALAHTYKITNIAQKQKNIVVYFRPDANIPPETITNLILGNKGKYMFTASENPYFTIKLKDTETKTVFQDIKSFLNSI
ncbi:MAG: transcription-repair coupling factor [Lachnospiraceae bacterium]|nr:transcription-repair coupling factor [Lachnospiraceae bacterium]